MNTSSFVRPADSRRLAPAAFTLIELLVVISIIAVLAGLLLPVTGSVMENARKTSAKSTEMQIVASIKSYQTDYGVYPVLTTTTSGMDTTVGGSVGANAELFGVLRATDSVASSPNTRRVVYFEGKDVKTPSKPKDGFLPTGGSTTGNNNQTLTVGDLVDPWGNRYFVCYDSGYTDQVAHPYASSPSSSNDDGGGAFDSSKMLRTGVIAWSWGKDGQKGNKGTVTGSAPTITSYGDDVVSWQ